MTDRYTLHRMDPEAVQRFREHETDDVPDSDDAARSYESEDGRDADFGAFSGLPFALGFTFVVVVLAALIAAFWPH
jgi:hypothetical protein